MIRARLTNGDFLLGIDAENVKRMKAGMPLRIDLRALGGSDTVMVMYGETMNDVMAELEQATGQKFPREGSA